MAYEQVTAQFSTANTYASSATGRADSFITSLSAVVAALRAPDVDIDQDWPASPTLAPDVSITVSEPGTNFPADDTGLAPSAPDIAIAGGGTVTAPTLATYSYSPGAFPTKPELDALTGATLPDALGDWTPPTPPTLLNIAIRPFEGVNTYPDWADRLGVVPDVLALDAPSPFDSPLPARYDSALLQGVIDQIRLRLAGGTGLAPAVEQLIWDRGRSREAGAAEANIAEAVKNAEARGFMLPTGAMHAQIREAQKTLLGKSAELSRDISMKQADLEQANAKHAIEQGIALESRLIDYVNNIEQRTFDAAKFAASNAVEIYNAQVTQYRAVLERYNAIASVYRSLMEGEKLKVDVYRAEIDAERAKVDINKNLIEQERIEIEIRNAQVALYRAELEAVQAVLAVDKMKIEAFAERIRAYTAEVNIETVKVEVFKAQQQSNAILTDIYKTNVEAYAALLTANSTEARTRAEVYDSQVRGFGSKVQAYATRVGAEAERVKALLGIEALNLDLARTQVTQNTSNNQLQIENYKALLGFYESNKQIAVSKAKVLGDNYLALKAMVADASKVGAQVNAQMAASAYGTLHASAQIQGSDSTNASVSYSGATSDEKGWPF